ncbi:MAG TPA: glycosyltransferase family 4 protein, partial [Blastocatellia bacterium]|nr:glycosyltransferase family 4 protein [Blastocatellia bacterium]
SVLIISSEYPPFLLGGLGTHVYELTKGLQRRGVKVYVFAHNPGRNEVVTDGDLTVCYFSMPGVNPSQGPAERELDFNDVRQLNRVVAERAKRLLSERNAAVDIIHSHDWFGFEAGCELRRTFGAPLISTVHMLYNPFITWWGSPLSPAIVKAETAMCTQSDLVITVSHAMKQAIVGAYGANPNSVKVIHNGFEPLAATDHVLEATAGLRGRVAASGEKIVLYAGRLAPMKGLEQLLLSASRVVKEFENIVYLVCGRHLDDSYAWELIKLVERDGNLRKRVKLLGWQSREQLQALYSIADLAVVPSRFEPFGYAALEAMAAQVPVVATDVGGLSEVLAGDVGGLLVPLVAGPGGQRHADVAKLAEAQLTLLKNPDLAREMATSGQRRANTEFGFDKMIDSTLEAYSHEARAPEAREHCANS